MKTIPITKLRNFYKSLSELRLSFETQLNIAKDFNRKENFGQLISMYKESKEHFALKYENVNEPFCSKSLRKFNPSNKDVISKTQDVVSVFQTNNCKVKVINDSNYDFNYIEREVSTFRTTNSVFETGLSGKSSGTGGIDFIGINTKDSLPILGEIKVAGDQNAFYALIQLLTYLSEMSTPNQITRIIKSNLFSVNIKPATSFYLYLVFTHFSGRKREILNEVIKLARNLANADLQEIQEIVFLNIDKYTKEISKI
ncbi:MAG: hypothetical protein JW870_16920 [Candidatus Delongbacteria bacterium]|nr:hypothetical protein [Candidatus Delongbacteria bacterium]